MSLHMLYNMKNHMLLYRWKSIRCRKKPLMNHHIHLHKLRYTSLYTLLDTYQNMLPNMSQNRIHYMMTHNHHNHHMRLKLLL